jgi:hypothetical protein
MGPSPGWLVRTTGSSNRCLSNRSRKGGTSLASLAIPTDFVDAIASEIADGVDRAVECWMSQIEQALTDIHLTSLGRLNAVREVLDQYKHLTGKAQLERRNLC